MGNENPKAEHFQKLFWNIGFESQAIYTYKILPLHLRRFYLLPHTFLK